MKRFFLCLLAMLILFGCAGKSKYIEYDKRSAWKMPKAGQIQIKMTAPTQEDKAKEIHWRNDMGVKYIKKAIKEEKLILLYFYNDSCPYCYKMVKETFSSEPIITMVNRKFYAFRIDVGDLSDQEKEMFGVKSVPMVLVLKPDKDPEKTQLFGLRGFRDGDITFLFLLGTLN